MDLIEITSEYAILNNDFYDDTIVIKGNTYLMRKPHMKKIVDLGLGRKVEGLNDLPHLPREELRQHNNPLRVLLIFTGGYGDAVSVAVLLDALQAFYNISFDICCKKEIWEYILKPCGFTGNWIMPPADLKTIHKYDYIQTRIDNFFKDKTGMYNKCIVHKMGRAYGVNLDNHRIQFTIPEAIKRSVRLPPGNKIRLGLSFDSNGQVKSYPRELQSIILRHLLDVGFEIYVFGHRNPEISTVGNSHSIHDYCGMTTIPELAALICQMDIVLGVDSFIAHLSDILGINTVVLLSVTRKGLFSWHKNVMCLESEITCTPCGQIADECPKEYSQCQAFFHESIRPEKIANFVIKECINHFQNSIKTSNAFSA